MFAPDIFSRNRPGWCAINDNVADDLHDVLSHLKDSLPPIVQCPEQSDALEINSNNFRLITKNGYFLLKRWSRGSIRRNLENTLSIMDWLAFQELPIPAPIRFSSGDMLIATVSDYWTVFPFVDGNYFAGTCNQLDSAADVCGRLMETLAHLPLPYMPAMGPEHLSDYDGSLLKRVGAASGRWDSMFGEQYASLLSEYWSTLTKEWAGLVALGPDAGPVQAVHFDLHPHNILMNGNVVAAVLDFDSCKLMRVGYALAFAGLKQCRQVVANDVRGLDPAVVGRRYKDKLSSCLSTSSWSANQFGDLAISEVLRRVCLILKLNIEDGDKTWNHILPIQLAHVREARALFG